MFTYAHVKWFYGQSERAYYLNYFFKRNCEIFIIKIQWDTNIHIIDYQTYRGTLF